MVVGVEDGEVRFSSLARYAGSCFGNIVSCVVESMRSTQCVLESMVFHLDAMVLKALPQLQ